MDLTKHPAGREPVGLPTRGGGRLPTAERRRFVASAESMAKSP